MGYYLKMHDILKLQTRSQKQIANWKEELQNVGKTLEILGDTNELQGETGTALKDDIKNVHMPIKAEIEALLNLFREILDEYIKGFMELEESNIAIIEQEVLESQQKQLNLYKESYTGICEDIEYELSKVSDLFNYSLEFHVSEMIDKLVLKLKDINENIGEYDVLHANDMSSIDEKMSLVKAKLSI